ncbi:hypothetical protein EPO15_04785 [bacterium]|nr:MAG: hypothetical protein EPO15_04785 [bacterium]
MMRRAIAAVLLSILPAGASAMPTIADADAKFAKGLNQEALALYEAVLSSGPEADRPKALWRACEAEALLFRYGSAYERLRAAELPGGAAWGSRFLLLKAELGREYLTQYGDSQPEDVEEGASDAFRLTEDQLRAGVDAAFQKLWTRREDLAAVPIEDESYVVEADKADRARYPTFLDFVVLRWTNYLLEQAEHPENALKPRADSFIKEDYDGKVAPGVPPAALAGAVFEEAARLKGDGREAARELWKMSRANIPRAAGEKVAPFDDAAKGQEETAALYRRWFGTFKTPEGRASAGNFAADLLNELGRPDEAAALCDSVVSAFPGTYGADRCARLAAQIRLPELSLSARVVPPPGRGALTVYTRNVPKLHFRLYPVTPEEVRASFPRGERGPWSNVLNAPSDALLRQYVARPPARSWSVDPAPTRKHVSVSTTADLPDASPGLYLAVVSGDAAFAPGTSLLSASLVNVTGLVLFGNAGLEGLDRDFSERPGDAQAVKTAPAFRVTLLDGASGRPVKGARLDVSRARDWNWRSETAVTDELGRAQLSETVSLRQGVYTSAQADFLARQGASLAYWASPLHFYFSVPERLRVLLETDRPIYRPGQTVLWKATVLERTPQGWKAHAGAKVTLGANDPNGSQFYNEAKDLSALGSAQGSFVIPSGRLLGGYSLQAHVNDGPRNYSGYVNVNVEEYKRPEFEVEVEASTGAWRYGRPVTVAGKASYYFGGPVPDSSVTYTVTRETWMPWWCWWWSWRPRGGTTEVLRGEAKTDAEGRLKFSFTPQPEDLSDKSPLPARFVVKVEARDAGGRTLNAERTFTAGAQAALFRLTPSGGFGVVGKDFSVSARLVSLDEAPLSGKGRWRLMRLDGDPADGPAPEAWGGDFPQSPALDQAYKDVKDGSEVRSGKLALSAEGETHVALAGLPAGVYRLRTSAEEPWGGSAEAEAVLAVVDPAKGVPLKLGSVTVPEKTTYAVGETARFLLGSAFLEAPTQVEIWGGAFLLERRVVEGKGPRLLTLALDERHKGGVTVRWFGVKDYRVRAGAVTVAVPWKDKELKVRLDVPKVLKPGQKASARLSVSDAKGRPASGEGTLRMYDRSLEYYAAGQADPGLGSLYPARPWPTGAVGSQRELSSISLRVDAGWINELLSVFQRAAREPLPPALRLNRGRAYGRYGKMRMMAMDGFAMAAPSPAALAEAGGGGMMLEQAKSSDASSRSGMAAEKKENAAPPPPVKARSDFSETAFFAPQVPVKAGKGAHAFKVPERLTSYRVTGYVVTPAAAYALVAAETDVRKDLMVRVESPRYLREGDRSTFKALVNNLSPKALKVRVDLDILQDGKDAGARFALDAGTQEGTVAKDGTASFSWPVTAPEGIGQFKLRATVRSGAEADAEERDLPLLPARQRLVESVLVALSGDGKKTLKSAKLAAEDPSRQDELLQLQVDPQLALTVLNALPFLIEYPHECVEQTLNRWLPAAVVSKVYAKHPAIAKAAAKVPKRSTITPPWEQEDPKRLQSLMESPWLQVSQGLKSAWPLVDMLSPAAVAATERSAFERLQNSQLPDGSFPWFPGGRGDPYMTLYVLAGFAEARHYGVNVPSPMLRSAVRYAMGEVPRRMKPEEGDLAFILYASYVLTAFPEELKGSVPELARAKELARSWLTFAAKHDRAFTRLGHAYASYAWRRLGDVKKAESYLDRAMDAARHDELTGTHWTPEKNSWVWYNDDLETHAFLIRTLQTLRPKDQRLAGMVQWLLFNRKGSVWKSTKASAAAVFALLDYMEKTGSLSKGDTFTVRWGGLSDAAQVGPADWLERPLRWTKTGQRSSADAEASVTKTGPGFAFASLTHIYSTTKLEDASAPGVLTLDRRFFKRVKKGDSYSLEPLASGATVKVGDTVVTRLTLTSRGQMEYLHLKDPRGAGFEAETLRSGWTWDGLSRYEEPRDSLTNYFVNWMPQGEYKLESRVRPTTPGRYRVGSAVLQSMYAPEFAARSAGFELVVSE